MAKYDQRLLEEELKNEADGRLVAFPVAAAKKLMRHPHLNVFGLTRPVLSFRRRRVRCWMRGGRRNASWLYSWCHDHEDAIHAQVDILRNAERAFRS
ncbi:MAG: hypothetical protein KBT68_00215 [bacterium]|nr:hypothetical protein [Candidatus Colisoma equi]